MATEETSFGHIDSENNLFQQIDTYPWDSDEEFQSGLRAILGQGPTSEQIEPLTLRARCFYYSRKYNVPIDFTAYSSWHAQPIARDPVMNGISPHSSHTPSDNQLSTTPAPSNSTSMALSDSLAAPYPLSFNRVVDLITSGEPIPGIKDIPDTVLEGQASNVTKSTRKKPWEKDVINEGIDMASTTVASPQDG